MSTLVKKWYRDGGTLGVGGRRGSAGAKLDVIKYRRPCVLLLKVSVIEALIPIMLFVFDKFHTIHNWAKKGIYFFSEMVQTSSLNAIILFVFEKFHRIHNWAKKGIFTISSEWFKHPL